MFMSKKTFSLILSVSLSLLFSSMAFAASAAGAYFVETKLIYDIRTGIDSNGVLWRTALISDQIEIVLTPMLPCDQLAQVYLYIDGIRSGNFAQDGCSGRRTVISGGGRTFDDPEQVLNQLSQQLKQYIASHTITVQGTVTNPDGTQNLIQITNPQLIDFSQGPISLSSLIPKELMTLTKDPVNIATGEATFSSSDFSMNGRGPVLSFRRSFRSFSSFSGMLGYGWRTDLDVNLTQNSNGDVTIYSEDGSGIYFLDQAGLYIPSPGNHSTLVKNADNTFTLTDKHGYITRYNSSGRLSSRTDRNGNQLTFVYNPSLTGGTYLQDAGGRRITLYFDANLRVVSAVDPAGKTFQYGYDAGGNLTSIQDPTGAITTYLYDANHKVIQWTNANGHKTYFQYDAQGRVVTNWQDNNVNKIVLDYQPYRTTVTTDSLGNKNTYLFNDFGLLVDHTDPLGTVTRRFWDGFMNQTVYLDALGNQTSFDHDGFGNLRKITDPRSLSVSMTYTPKYNLLVSRREEFYPQRTTNYEYDAKGNLTVLIDPMGNRTGYTYDLSGNLTKVTDSLGRDTTFVYDSYGNILQKVDALGGKVILSYDLNGNVLTQKDPLNNTTSYQYDNLNRLLKTTFANATTVLLAYDPLGNQIRMTDQRGKATLKTYDAYDRLSHITDANGGITKMDYDTEGRLTKLTDANERATNYVYDKNGRLLSQTNALNLSTYYTYDPVGNLTGMTDANGNTTSYLFDVLNRLKKTTYPDNTTVTNSYDNFGRIGSVTDVNGQITYGYDDSDRLLSKTGPGVNNSIFYSYDTQGNLLTIKDQNNRVVTNTYDALDRLASVQDLNGLTTYGYDAASNLKTVLYPNGVTASYTYDKLNRILTMVNKRANLTVVSSVSNVYDVAGMITKKTWQDGTWTSYTYDALNQLRSEIKRNSRSIIYNHAFTYDSVGNRLTWSKNTTLGGFWSADAAAMPPQVLTNMTNAGYGSTATPSQAVTLKRTYSYDSANRLTTWNYAVNINTASFPVQTNTYTHDANGNRLSKQAVLTGQSTTPQQTSYSYDFENQLKQLTYVNVPKITGTQIDSFVYNAEGLRTQAVINGTASSYLYDGGNILVERNSSGATVKSYTRGLDLGGGIGGLIAQNTAATSSTAQYYQYNDGGSASNLTTSTGTTFSSYNYDAFGNLLSPQAASDTNRYLFSTKEFDPRSGLYYFGARYYDPEVGRWLTPDPMGFVDGMNLYAYVNNSPINLIDPHGYLGERLGADLGEDALNYYASRWSETGNPLWTVPGFFSALWTPDTYLSTSTVLATAYGVNLWGKTPRYYQYYPKGNPSYDTPWLTKGTNLGPPYKTGSPAQKALNLPPYNPGTAVRPVSVSRGESIVGPRTPKPQPDWGHPNPGTGHEYYRGGAFPD